MLVFFGLVFALLEASVQDGPKQFTNRGLKMEGMEDLNLIMFPASKNYPLEEDFLADPIEEVLNEFSHLDENQLDDFLNSPMERIDYERFSSKNIGRDMSFLKDRIGQIKEKIQNIEKENRQLKSLLDEIELYHL